MKEEKVYQHWLYGIDGIGKLTRQKLYDTFGSAENIYRAKEKQILPLLTEKQAEVYREARKTDPERIYDDLVQSGIRFITHDDPVFPRKLRDIPDAPAALYVKGRLPDPEVPAVAVVGARFCSSYGRYMARQFGLELAQSGFQVISGMALGVDGIAQTAALQAGGYSAGVLGCGVDVCYPPENRALHDSLCAQGGIISEYVPGTVPKPGLFPPRNRIISGLADAVLVVEARAKSGTLITVDMALEQGRDVFVLPGRATDRLSDGCNLLLKQGAIPAMQASDITEYYLGVRDEEECAGRGNAVSVQTSATGRSDRTNRQPVKPQAAALDATPAQKGTDADTGRQDPAAGRRKPHIQLTALERSLLEALDIHPQPVADILDQPVLAGIGAGAQEMLCTLTELSLRGLVEQQGNCFARRL